MTNRAERDEHVRQLCSDLLPPETATAVTTCSEFGALATNLAKAADDDLDAMTDLFVQTVEDLDTNTLAWIPSADSPAGFLASRVKRTAAELIETY